MSRAPFFTQRQANNIRRLSNKQSLMHELSGSGSSALCSPILPSPAAAALAIATGTPYHCQLPTVHFSPSALREALTARP